MGDMTPVLSGGLVSDCGVGSFRASTLSATPPALSGPGCGPQTFHQSSVFWDTDRHHLRESRPDRLSECQILGLAAKFLLLPTPHA